MTNRSEFEVGLEARQRSAALRLRYAQFLEALLNTQYLVGYRTYSKVREVTHFKELDDGSLEPGASYIVLECMVSASWLGDKLGWVWLATLMRRLRIRQHILQVQSSFADLGQGHLTKKYTHGRQAIVLTYSFRVEPPECMPKIPVYADGYSVTWSRSHEHDVGTIKTGQLQSRNKPRPVLPQA